MYKRQNLTQLFETSNNFVATISRIIYKERSQTLVNLIKLWFKMWDTVYYFNGNDPFFRMQKLPNNEYMLVSESERIELLCTDSDIKKLSTIIANPKKANQNNKSILDILMEERSQWQYETINDKPYITYDIETLMAPSDNLLHTLEFELWYAINSTDCKTWSDKANKYISKDSIKKFTDFLLDFDGYIVWFNNLAFDNKVIAYQAWYWQEEIDKLNAKSIDVFMFLWNKINKRIWLNKVATAMIWLAKNLDISWDGMQLIQDWLQNSNQESLEKVKKYCKNDVKMTLWILLYFIKYQEFYIDWEKVEFSIEEFVELASRDRNKKQKTEDNKKSALMTPSLFG